MLQQEFRNNFALSRKNLLKLGSVVFSLVVVF